MEKIRTDPEVVAQMVRNMFDEVENIHVLEDGHSIHLGNLVNNVCRYPYIDGKLMMLLTNADYKPVWHNRNTLIAHRKEV